MSTQNTPVTAELKQVIETHPHIEEVHFTADGHYHFRVFPYGKDLYTRLEETQDKTKSGLVIPNKFTNTPLKTIKGEDDPAFKIVATLTAKQVMEAPLEEGPKSPSIITKAELLISAQDLSTEELQQLLKDKKAKK